MPDAYNPWGAPVFPTADDNAMQPETFVPQGVQDWTRQAAPKDYNILSQIAGSLGKALMYPGQVAQSQVPISTEDMVAPAFNLASMLTLGAGAAPQEANALNMGIKAYHGSPHDFDKFDLSKIGTGEGAQAYGHGLYFADNPAVAQQYREALSPGYEMRAGGAEYNSSDPVHLAAHHLDMFGKRGVPREEIAARLREDAHLGERYNKAADLIDSGAALPEFARVPAGHTYEVNINADPSHFLDWDKPLSQQHPKVQEGIAPLVEEMKKSSFLNAKRLGSDPTGEQIYSTMGTPFARRQLTGDSSGFSNKAGSTDIVSQAGIPGIKYLDQGSRGAGQGSSNYVVFNHDLIDIMRKYAVPGMLGAPILANALSEQKT